MTILKNGAIIKKHFSEKDGRGKPFIKVTFCDSPARYGRGFKYLVCAGYFGEAETARYNYNYRPGNDFFIGNRNNRAQAWEIKWHRYRECQMTPSDVIHFLKKRYQWDFTEQEKRAVERVLTQWELKSVRFPK